MSKITLETIREAMELITEHGGTPDGIVVSPEILNHFRNMDEFKGAGLNDNIYGLKILSVGSATDMYVFGDNCGVRINKDGSIHGGAGPENMPFVPKCGKCAVMGKLCKQHAENKKWMTQ